MTIGTDFHGSDGGPLPKRRSGPCEGCGCPEPGCQCDEDKFALMRIGKAIVEAHDYGGSASTICRAVSDNIDALRSIVNGK